jgi:hypothetical protein
LLQAGYLIAAIPAFAVLGAIGIKTVAGWTAERLVRASSALARGKSRRPRRETAMFGLSLVAVVAGIFVVIPFVVSWGAYGTVVQDGPAETAYIVGLTRAGDGIIFDQPPQRMIFDYYLFADFHQAARFPPLPAPIWPSAGWGTELPFAADHSVLTPAAISALDGRFTRIWVVDGGWKPLPKYVSQSQVMLHRLARKYPVVGETYFRGVKILLFSRSGPLPPGMKPWVGNG